MAEAESKQSWAAEAKGYISGSIDELKKVQRPTKQEAIQATIVTVILVIVVAIVVSLFDVVFAQVMKAVIS